MKSSYLFICLALLCLLGLTNAYSDMTGRTCTDMPDHGGAALSTGTGGYSISLSKSTYYPGDVLNVTISGKATFKGWVISAYNASSGTRIGEFMARDYLNHEPISSECLPERSTGANNFRDEITSQTYFWTAPKTSATYNITFKATVVKAFSTFYKIQSSPLLPTPAVVPTSPAQDAVVLPNKTVSVTWNSFGIVTDYSYVNLAVINVANQTVMKTFERLPNNGSFPIVYNSLSLSAYVIVNITAYDLRTDAFLATNRTKMFLLSNGTQSVTVTAPTPMSFITSDTITATWAGYGYEPSNARTTVQLVNATNNAVLETRREVSGNAVSLYSRPIGLVYLNLTVRFLTPIDGKNGTSGRSGNFSSTILGMSFSPSWVSAYNPGSVMNITWSSEGYNKTGTVVRMYLINKVTLETKLTLPITDNDDQHSITIPNSIDMCGRFFLNISVTATTPSGAVVVLATTTSGVFAISTVIVNTPRATDVFIADSLIRVNYTTPGFDRYNSSTIRIALISRNSSTVLSTIDVYNEGSYLFPTNSSMVGVVYFNVSMVGYSSNISSNFVILDRPTVVFTNPTPNKIFAAGASVNLTWYNIGYNASATYIRLVLVNATNNATIQTYDKLKNNGSFLLTTKSAWTRFFLINATAYYTANNSKVANNRSPIFYLSGPAIEITSVKPDMYPVGYQFTVQWTTFNLNTSSTYIRLSLVNATKGSAVVTLDKLANNGSYTFPKQNMTGKFFFAISCHNISNNGQVTANRTATFAWTHFQFQSPTLGQTLINNFTYSINWTTTLPATGNVKLDLVKNSTQVVTPLNPNTPNNGQATFTVPTGAPSASDYYILATSVENGTNRGQSYFFNVSVAIITVLYPDASTVMVGQLQYEFKWKCMPQIYLGLIRIELCPFPDSCFAVKDQLSNTGSATAQLPSRIPSSTVATVKIIAYRPSGIVVGVSEPFTYVASS